MGNGPHSLEKMLDVIKKEDDECTLLNSGVTTCIRFPDQFNSDQTDDVLCNSRKRGAGHSIQSAAEPGPHFNKVRLKATATTILNVVFIACPDRIEAWHLFSRQAPDRDKFLPVHQRQVASHLAKNREFDINKVHSV